MSKFSLKHVSALDLTEQRGEKQDKPSATNIVLAHEESGLEDLKKK